jgi:hypothetical protein
MVFQLNVTVENSAGENSAVENSAGENSAVENSAVCEILRTGYVDRGSFHYYEEEQWDLF